MTDRFQPDIDAGDFRVAVSVQVCGVAGAQRSDRYGFFAFFHGGDLLVREMRLYTSSGQYFHIFTLNIMQTAVHIQYDY